VHLARRPANLVRYSGEKRSIEPVWLVAERGVEEALFVESNNSVEGSSIEDEEVM
jgi:hypothetical protein